MVFGATRAVQFIPSGDVIILFEAVPPEDATAQNNLNSGDQQTLTQRLSFGAVLAVHTETELAGNIFVLMELYFDDIKVPFSLNSVARVVPDIIAFPFTSNVSVGAVLLIPTLLLLRSERTVLSVV